MYSAHVALTNAVMLIMNVGLQMTQVTFKSSVGLQLQISDS